MKSIYFWTAVAVYAFISWVFQFTMIANVVAISLVMLYGLYDFFESFFMSIDREMHDLRREVAYLKRELNITFIPPYSNLETTNPAHREEALVQGVLSPNRDVHAAI